MKIEIKSKMGIANKAKGAVREWRKDPANLTAACVAARYYADKEGEEMVVVGGNSYGCAVYNVVRKTEDLRKFTVMKCEATVAVVFPGGEVFQAIAS